MSFSFSSSAFYFNRVCTWNEKEYSRRRLIKKFLVYELGLWLWWASTRQNPKHLEQDLFFQGQEGIRVREQFLLCLVALWKGIPFLFEDNGLVILQFGKKEKKELLFSSSSDLRVRLGDLFFHAQSLSPDLDSTGKTLFAMRPCKEGSWISITASFLCTRYLVAIPRKRPLPSSFFFFH